MKLKIQNVAKVKEADVDINGITVIAGYNGTGKSTISKSLYTMLLAYSNLELRIKNERDFSLRKIVYEWVTSFGFNYLNYNETKKYLFLQDELIDSIVDYLAANSEVLLDRKYELIFDKVKKIIDKYEIENNKIDNDQIKILFENTFDVLNRPDYLYAYYLANLTANRIFKNQINTFNEGTIAKISLQISDKINSIEFKDNEVSSFIFGCKTENSVYLETQNILDGFTSKRYRVSGGFRKTDSLLKHDILEKYSFEEYYSNKNDIHEVRKIIDHIVNGTIKKNDDKILTYYDNNYKHDVEFTNISSGLKNFIIIKRLIENGSLSSNGFLIIDEPEVNLHPEWQLKFAELLVLMNKEMNINLFLNTHSPYFLRAIEHYSSIHEVADKGKYYFMQNDGGKCRCIDVTNNTKEIYATLSKPLHDILNV